MSAAPADRPSSDAVERVRRRLRVGPRWAAVVALVAMVGLTWGVWYVTHRQFLATWSINAVGGRVEWQLDEGHWRHGGTSHVSFQGTGWDMRDVEDRDLEALAQLAHVRSLTMNRCRKVTDRGLAKVLPRLPELRELHLSNAPIYPQDTDAWPLSESVLVPVASLEHLEELSLTDLNITDAGLAHLTGLESLKFLDLSGTRITDASLRMLATEFPALEHVVLERTQVTDGGVLRLMQARNGLAIDHPALLPPSEQAVRSP
jgi:hypothetical protein